MTGGIDEALALAFDAAGGGDVRLGGGAATAPAYLAAGFVDETHVAVVPTLLHGGERLFDEAGAPAGMEVVEFATSPTVAPVVLRRA